MNPALKNAPAPCRADGAWRSSVQVRYPYMGVDSAVVTIDSLEPTLSLLSQSFDIGPQTPVPTGAIGWDSVPERSYRQRLQAIGQEAKFFAKGTSGVRSQIRELGKAALTTLNVTIPKFYNEDPRLSLGGPLSQQGKGLTPAAAVARDRLRHDIIEAYRYAAQLLWCAEFGMAQVEAYQANRDEFEAPIKPGPGDLVDPAWTQYEPTDFSELDWNMKEVAPFEGPLIPTTTDDEQQQEGGGMGAIAVVAVVGIGALLLLRR